MIIKRERKRKKERERERERERVEGLYTVIAQSAGAVEYTDCFSAER